MIRKLYHSGLFDYQIKWLAEAAWAGLIAAGTVGLQVLSATDVGEVAEWDTWLVALGAACGRAFLAALLGRR